LTVIRYGDTFQTTRGSVGRLVADGVSFGDLPYFIALTNPDLRVTDPGAPPRTTQATDVRMDAYTVNGRPKSPCDGDDSMSLSIGSLKLFHTNSGWMMYLCRERN
jgi:hypothetical protein